LIDPVIQHMSFSVPPPLLRILTGFRVLVRTIAVGVYRVELILSVATVMYLLLSYVYSDAGELWNTIGSWLITAWNALLIPALAAIAIVGELD
jgi:hypothetical protein